MCCCHCQNRCCGGSSSGTSGTVTLSALSELARLAGSTGNSSTTTRWPVYVSVPAFLMDVEEESSDSCGCCRG